MTRNSKTKRKISEVSEEDKKPWSQSQGKRKESMVGMIINFATKKHKEHVENFSTAAKHGKLFLDPKTVNLATKMVVTGHVLIYSFSCWRF